jgi:hypothetical protein
MSTASSSSGRDLPEDIAPPPSTKRRTNRLALTALAVLALLVAGWVVCIWTSICSRRCINNNEVKVKNDIQWLTDAVGAFQTKFNVPYMPSRIRLCEKYQDYDLANPLDRDSAEFLTRVWPRLHHSDPDNATYPWTYGRTPELARTRWIDWNGDGVNNAKGMQNGGAWTLEGDQCLVFFLGGITWGKLCLGFSTVPFDPAQGGGARSGPFYDFSPGQLVDFHDDPFRSCLDRHGGKPYAYFSAYKAVNGYNRYFQALADSDCSKLGVWPYATSLGSTPKYLNPRSFQIISAGADHEFGRGSPLPGGPVWTPATASDIDAPGRDDQSNFYDKLLGVKGR